MKLLLVATLIAILAKQLCAAEIGELLALDRAKEATKTALENPVDISVWLPEVISELDDLDPSLQPDDDSYRITSLIERNLLQLMCSALMDNLQVFKGTPLEAVVLNKFGACTDSAAMQNLSADEITQIKVQLRLILFTKGAPLFFMFLQPVLEWVFK